MDNSKLYSMIDQDVKITSTRGHVYRGCVKAIDPLQKSYVLMTMDDDKLKLNYINGSYIKCVSKLGKSILAGVDPFPPKEALTKKKLVAMRNKLKEWFSSKGIDIIEDGLKLILYDTVIIHPPYRSSECTSTNIVVLERVQNLMESFPGF